MCSGLINDLYVNCFQIYVCGYIFLLSSKFVFVALSLYSVDFSPLAIFIQLNDTNPLIIAVTNIHSSCVLGAKVTSFYRSCFPLCQVLITML